MPLNGSTGSARILPLCVKFKNIDLGVNVYKCFHWFKEKRNSHTTHVSLYSLKVLTNSIHELTYTCSNEECSSVLRLKLSCNIKNILFQSIKMINDNKLWLKKQNTNILCKNLCFMVKLLVLMPNLASVYLTLNEKC